MTGFAERYDQLRQTIAENIDKHGWHATGVFPTAGDDIEQHPPFIYSVGLAEQGLPEILVFGDAEQFHGVLSTAVDRLRSGELRPTPQRTGLVLVGLDVWLIDINAEHIDDRLGTATDRAEGRTEGFRAMQLIWPDAENRFPWEDGYNLPAWYQPILGDTPTGQ